MDNFKILFFAFFSSTVAFGAGCQEGDSEEAALTRHLADRGYDVSRIAFVGDQITLDDVHFWRADVLVEMAASPAPAESDLVEKGFWYRAEGGNLGIPPAANLKLIFGAGVSESVKAAVRIAAREWSAHTACVNISENNTGDPITFVVFPLEGGFLGQAFGVTNRKVGSRFGIDDDHAATGSQPEIISTVLHEMGHTLGFMHPGEGFRIRLTRGGTDYQTVMDNKGSPPDQTLTRDDVVSLLRRYSRCGQ